MGIEAIGGAGAAGSIGLSAYLQNNNRLNANSLNPIAGLTDSVSSGRIDFSELLSEEVNANPLRLGETKGFMDILSMQMQIGYQNAARIVTSSDFIDLNVEEIAENAPNMDTFDDRSAQYMADMEAANQASALRNVSDVVQGVDILHTVQGTSEDLASDQEQQLFTGEQKNLYRMQKAIDSYMAWM